MNLANLILVAILILVLSAAVFALTMAIGTYIRFRGKRLITCPETLNPAAVHVNVARAARETVFGEPRIRLDQCSRWPERQDCGQECLSQVHADGDSCLVWNMVEEWYRGKSCVYCQKPFGEIHWHDHHPALLGPDRNAMQWNEIPSENLPAVFQNYLPVCWNCFVAETYRRQHPGQLVDRKWDRSAGGEYIPGEHVAPATQKPIARN